MVLGEAYNQLLNMKGMLDLRDLVRLRTVSRTMRDRITKCPVTCSDLLTLRELERVVAVRR